MKKQALSSVGLVLGGCLWFAISGYGGSGHDHGHGAERPAVPEVDAIADFVLNDEVKAKLNLEVGTVEMPDIPGSNTTVIAVPVGAISNPIAGGKATVYFTEDTGEAGAIQKFAATEVEIGAMRDGYFEIISGLLPGDVVIVKNATRIDEEAIGGVSKNQVEPIMKQSNSGGSTQLSEPTKVEVDQVESAKAPVQSNASAAAVTYKTSEVCDSRCPFENQAPKTFCPNDAGHSYQDSGDCDRDNYRRSLRGSHYRDRSGCRW